MYYKSTGEHNSVIKDLFGVCADIIEYNWSTWETVLVRQSTTGERGKCADTEDYYRGTGAAVLVQ